MLEDQKFQTILFYILCSRSLLEKNEEGNRNKNILLSDIESSRAQNWAWRIQTVSSPLPTSCVAFQMFALKLVQWEHIIPLYLYKQFCIVCAFFSRCTTPQVWDSQFVFQGNDLMTLIHSWACWHHLMLLPHPTELTSLSLSSGHISQ